MSSTFSGLEIAKSGLSVAMQNLSVTEQNIANANTVGYSRQRLNQAAKSLSSSAYLISPIFTQRVGDGVEATGVQQIRSSYLDQQFRNLNTNFSYNSSKNQTLTYLDGLLNETNEDGGLKTAIGNFFSALNTFSSDTSSKENRTNVQQQALGMTESFNNVYEEMQSLWNDQNSNIETLSDEINSTAQKIAELNDSISKSAQTGSSANELNDERNQLLDKLSGYVNITYSANAANSNMVDVQIGGADLITGNTVNKISVDTASAHSTDIDNLTQQVALLNTPPAATNATALSTLAGQLNAIPNIKATVNPDSSVSVTMGGASLVNGTTQTTVSAAANSSLDAGIALNVKSLKLDGTTLSIADGNITGGQLYASMEMVSSSSASASGIPYYMSKLNDLVQEIAKNLNTYNESGYTYPDGTNPSTQGVDLFQVPTTTGSGGTTVKDYSKITAGNFSISAALLNSVYSVAGSSSQISLTAGNTEAGNNTIALQMYKDLVNSGYNDSINSVVGNLAIASDTSKNIMNTQKSLVDSVDTQRTSTSGVSLDEESSNLIMYQQSYNACSRVVSAINDMLDNLINRMGVS